MEKKAPILKGLHDSRMETNVTRIKTNHPYLNEDQWSLQG